MNYQQTVQYLYNQLPVYQRIGKAAYKANLNITLKLDEYFGHPHLQFKSIHVAGTNGKGSTSHMIASILQSAGYKVGLYTSPHLSDFRERIKINGEMIAETDVICFVEKHKNIIEELQPSFFEMTVALAFDYFAKQQVDFAIIEVGMGGRLDSTNIINPLVSIITNIGLDHTEFLGDTKEKIAVEKAGIIKKNTPIIIGEWDELIAPTFYELANNKNANIIFADKALYIENKSTTSNKQQFKIKSISNKLHLESLTVEIDLLGTYQEKNILTVLSVIETLKQNNSISINNEAIIQGLANITGLTGLTGRWQILQNKPLIICDTGHNAHALRHTTQQLNSLNYNNLYIVIGVVDDKDINTILPLLPKQAYYFFTKADLPRAMNAHKLAEICKNSGLNGEVIPNVKQALQTAKNKAQNNDIIFIGGSTFVVAEVL